MPLDERFLVHDIANGSEAAARRLIDSYKGLVLHIIFRLVRTKEDRDDLCQEIFLKVFVNLKNFRHDSRLSTWIGNIAFNTTMHFLNKKKTVPFPDFVTSDNDEVKTSFEDNVVEETEADTILIEREEGVKLADAIERLPPAERLIVTLFHFDDLPYNEIAAITELPEGTVKSHLFRARRRLKNILEKLN